MKQFMLVAILSIFAITNYGQVKDAKVQQEFRERTKQYFAEFGKLSPEAMRKYFAPDPELDFYDISPMKFAGWAEYEKALVEILGKYVTLTIRPNEDLKATRRGDITWVYATFHLEGKKKDGKPMVMDGRHTAIWEKRGSQWLIVHEHWSRPTP